MCILGLPKEQIGRYLSIVIVIICTNFRNTSFAIDPKTLFIAPDIFFAIRYLALYIDSQTLSKL